jgi:hypothetical protein
MDQPGDDLTIPVPSDAVIRLHGLPSEAIPGGSILHWLVIVARPPRPADPSVLSLPGGSSVLLTHDPGATWTDANGAAAAREALGQDGGAVAFAFADRRGALACKARLEKARMGPATEDRH